MWRHHREVCFANNIEGASLSRARSSIKSKSATQGRSANAEEAYEAMRRHNARLSVGVLNLLRRQYALETEEMVRNGNNT